MNAPAEVMLRIGDVAERVGTTPRTIRYYEEVGLLAPAGERASGAHRQYTEADVERLRTILKLKDLLGVSLEQLRELVEAEDARAALRAEWHAGADDARRHEIVVEALGQVERQLSLVAARRSELDRLESDLVARRSRLRERLEELS